MIVALRLGLAEHQKQLSLEEFESAEFQEGYRYELIDGRLYVTPAANEPEDWNRAWIYDALRDYSKSNPRVINRVSFGARVFIPGRKATTCPEPDVSAYRDYRALVPRKLMTWKEVSPILVVEVLYDSDPHQDLIRNVELYLQVPSISEYWIVDCRDTPEEPTLIVHRREGEKWVVKEYGPGEVFETKLLPGFSLPIEPK